MGPLRGSEQPKTGTHGGRLESTFLDQNNPEGPGASASRPCPLVLHGHTLAPHAAGCGSAYLPQRSHVAVQRTAVQRVAVRTQREWCEPATRKGGRVLIWRAVWGCSIRKIALLKKSSTRSRRSCSLACGAARSPRGLARLIGVTHSLCVLVCVCACVRTCVSATVHACAVRACMHERCELTSL
jgi:hypothetical protein